MSLTINTTINGTLSLAPSNNPIAITASGGVAATATLADAIDGDSSTAWMISNAGTISSASGFGLYLNGPSSNLSNSGAISGAGGMFLNNGGSVTNTASGTITATGKMPSSLATISGIYVTGPSGAAISVTNAGVITAADGYGIGLGASGSVNNSGKVTGGEDGVLFDAGVGSLQNSGSITATLDDGVGMFQGGTVTNAVGASISGVAGVDGAGIFISGGAATITNNGQVNGARYAILVAAGGSVTNSSTGTIKGQGSGVSLSNGGTLSNSGAISSTASGSAAADLEFGGTINNLQGATLTGASFGAFINGALGSVVNSGTISSAGSFGVSINGGGNVQNNATGSIIGKTAGVNIANKPAAVVNSGLINATGSGGAAIETNAGGSVTNNSGATLSAIAFGFFASGVSATFSNAGKVTGNKAVGLYAGGSVVNLAGGQLTGQNAGVYISGAPGSVSNSGAISVSASGWPAIDLEAGGSVTNNTGGTITGTSFAVYDFGGSSIVSNAAGASMTSGSVTIFMRGDANKVANSGVITSPFNTSVELYGNGDVVTNTAGGVISAGAYGVFLGGPGTVTNLGSISGKSYAVDFSVNSSANLLQVGAGASFTGSVNGDGGVIELLSGGAGTIGGISNSGQFWGFQSLNVDAGGAWTLTGSDAIANVTDNGALTINGSLNVTSALNPASTGSFDLGAGGVLEVASATGAQTEMDFLGASRLVVDNAALFGTGIAGSSYLGSQLEDFGAGDSVDIHNFSASGATLAYDPSSGLLQLSNGGALATLDFQQSTLGSGSFHLVPDALGSGLLITRV